MDRPIDPVVLQARAVLEPTLERLGFAIASEYYGPEAFGSINTEYRRRGHRVELAWDGKDRWLWLKVAPSGSNGMAVPQSWQDLEAALGMIPDGRFLQPGPSAAARVKQLEAALKQFFRLAPAI